MTPVKIKKNGGMNFSLGVNFFFAYCDMTPDNWQKLQTLKGKYNYRNQNIDTEMIHLFATN